MGKKQHQKDKLYLTATEWATEWGGRRATAEARAKRYDDPDAKDFRRLPFDHCALSLQPYENPYADDDGNVYDLTHILPYIKRYKANPVTGKPMDASCLTKLKVHRNANKEIHCPVLFKVFNNSTHIAAIKSTGNVFSYEVSITTEFNQFPTSNTIRTRPFFRRWRTDTSLLISIILYLPGNRGTKYQDQELEGFAY
jgi:peptidyl-prolyl cis-trans isomerase-like protein 2